jgi:preprotein translocase subunit SecE
MKPVTYLKGVLHELKKVSWPSQKQGAYLTMLVITLSVAIAYYLGAFDYIFGIAFEAYII